MDKQSIVKGKTIKQVRKLNLSGQGLAEIPDYVFEYTNLTKLVLSHNAIKRIPKEIEKLKKLHVLDLSYNEIEFLPAPVFRLPKLRVLAVGHNKIKKFPSQMIGSSIEELIADHNRIMSFGPDAMDGLTKIVISNNPISGQIVTHFLPKLLYFDFRRTFLETPSSDFLPAVRRFRLPIHPAVITPEMIVRKKVFDRLLSKNSEYKAKSSSSIRDDKDMDATELIQKIILGDISLSQGLMLCRVLYKNSLSSESLQWINYELDHYEELETIPAYRILDCDVKVRISGPFFGTKTEMLDTSFINKQLDGTAVSYASPNKMLVRQGIESIEQSIGDAGPRIRLVLHPGQVDLLLKYYSYPSGYHIDEVYQECGSEELRAIIPAVKNRLISILENEVVRFSQKEYGIKTTKKLLFISYGWEDDRHCEWVRMLAQRLSEFFDVRIDVKVPYGVELNAFMETMITSAERVLLILTPTYKEKAENRQNGVGYESVLISTALYQNQGTHKFIPIIRKGNVKESYPLYLGTRKGLDMTNDEMFEQQLEDLIEDIRNN